MAISGVCLGIYPLRDPRPSILSAVPPSLFDVLLIAGFVSLAGAAIAVAALFVYLPDIAQGTQLCRPAKRSELELFHQFAVQYLGGTSSLNDTKRAYNINKDMFWGVWREQQRWFAFGYTSKLIGYFALIPVNEPARKLLASNSFEPHHVSNEYVVSEGRHPSALYIGGVTATIGNKGVVLAELILAVLAFQREGINEVFTRPVTSRGLKLATQYGFRPVASAGLNEIYQLQFDRVPSYITDTERPARIVREHRERLRRRRTRGRSAA